MTKRGRKAVDGATQVVRINIALTEEHRRRLRSLAGSGGASSWIRAAIDKEYLREKS